MLVAKIVLMVSAFACFQLAKSVQMNTPSLANCKQSAAELVKLALCKVATRFVAAILTGCNPTPDRGQQHG